MQLDERPHDLDVHYDRDYDLIAGHTDLSRPRARLGFVGGPEARRLAALPESERRDAVLASFERLFGPRAAAEALTGLGGSAG